MKVFFKNTKSTSKKTILTIFMVATLALSPLVPQLVEAKAEANKSFPIALNLMQIIDQLNLSQKQLTKIQNNLQSHQQEYITLTSDISSTKNQLLQLPTKASGDQLKSLAHVQSENIHKLIQLKVKNIDLHFEELIAYTSSTMAISELSPRLGVVLTILV